MMFATLLFLTILPALSTAQASTASGGPQSADGLQGPATKSPAVTSPVVEISGVAHTFRPEFTVPAQADVGEPVLPNIKDPSAKDAQSVCPGYTASNVVNNDLGFEATLTLAGPACNVYGNDIAALNLTVQYQSADRLAVRILPAHLDASNESYYVLDDLVVPQPQPDPDASSTISESDLSFTWTNVPTFQFSISRASTGDTLFSTLGSKLIYEDQFIEFVSSLPENYNVYGLGETIHQLRLGDNLTRTLYAADVGDVIDA